MKGHLKILLVVALALSGETVMARKSNSATQKNTAAVAENTDGLGNISKRKREELKQKIGEIKSFLEQSGDTNAVRLLRFAAELEREVGEKKYGLVFEEHRERVDAELERHLPVLTENKQRFIDNGGEVNFLIEGDNLAALKLLEKTHRGRIDLIYIDPPYNTGNKDFVYNDSYVDKTDGYRHSKWLSFMKKRLEIARRLMSDKGVIFISIDDNEQANLKLLCDGVFGEGNFVGSLPRVTKKSGKDHSDYIAQNHDYVVVYAKNKVMAAFNGFDVNATDFDKEDEYVSLRGKYKLNQTLDYDSLWYNPAMDFPLVIDGVTYYPGGSKKMYELRHQGKHNPKDWVWRWSKAKFDFGLENGFVEIKESSRRPRIYTKTYLGAKIVKTNKGYEIQYEDRKTKLSSLMFVDNEFSNDNGKKQMAEVIDANAFDFPKPYSLINVLLTLVQQKDPVVLDFFAGSGTTGHAVMKLNAEDGGHRTFILVTNNENGICENVTYKRLKNVIEKEKYKARLKYCKVDYVPIAEKVYYEYADDLLKHIRELVELENGIDFTHDESVAIALTTKDAENLVADEARLAKCRIFYRGHNVVMPLAVRNALERQGVEIRIIPTYYYPEQED